MTAIHQQKRTMRSNILGSLTGYYKGLSCDDQEEFAIGLVRILTSRMTLKELRDWQERIRKAVASDVPGLHETVACTLKTHPEHGGCCCQCRYRLEALPQLGDPLKFYVPNKAWPCIAFALCEGEGIAYIGDFEHGMCELFASLPWDAASRGLSPQHSIVEEQPR